MELGSAPITKNWKFLNIPESSDALTGILSVANDTLLNNKTLEFYDAAEEKGGIVEVVGIIVKEYHNDATPALQKCPFRFYMFRKCNNTLLSNQAFAFDQTYLDDLMGHIDITVSDYTDLEGGKAAYAVKYFDRPIKLDEDISVIQAIAIAKAAATYTANHSLSIQLIVAE